MSSEVEIYSTSTSTVHLSVRVDVNSPDYHDHLCAFFDDMIAQGLSGPFSWRPVEVQTMPLSSQEIADFAVAEVEAHFPLSLQIVLDPLARLSMLTADEAIWYVEGINWLASMRTEYAALVGGEPVFDPPVWPAAPANLATLVSTYRAYY